jgi:molybdate transport system permease protein
MIAGPLGIALAWLQARHRYALRTVVDALILLPLVLPPSVVGYFLVTTFGRHGAAGNLISRAFDVSLIFTPTAAVLASTFVALPLVAKTAQPAFEGVPRELEDVASTLGLGPLRLFLCVSVPVAWRGILAGLALGFARAAGEFGATLMFAGDIPGKTNTMPVEIFESYRAGQDARALVYVVILTGVSIFVALLAAHFGPRPGTRKVSRDRGVPEDRGV